MLGNMTNYLTFQRRVDAALVVSAQEQSWEIGDKINDTHFASLMIMMTRLGSLVIGKVLDR